MSELELFERSPDPVWFVGHDADAAIHVERDRVRDR